MSIKKWPPLTLALLLTSFCFAQSSPPIKKTQSTSDRQGKQEQKISAVVKFSMKVIETDRVDPGYLGTPVAELVKSIEKIPSVKKGEFESTADFNARVLSAIPDKLIGDSNVKDAFAFALSVKSRKMYDYGVKYSFNADTNDVQLFILPFSVPMNGLGSPDHNAMPVSISSQYMFESSFEIKDQSTYQGKNAYGATVTVEEHKSTSLGLSTNSLSYIRYKGENYITPSPAAQFKLSNVMAALELPHLKVLVIMKLVEPYILYDYQNSRPTFDSPVDRAKSRKFLNGSILGFVFYSGITGEIFARAPEAFGLVMPIKESSTIGEIHTK
jgi:hypothetical protein